MLAARPGRLDLLFTAILVAGGVVLMVSNVQDPDVDATPLVVPAFLLVTLPLLLRTTAPRLALLAMAAGIGFHVGVFGELTRCGIVFPATWLLVFAAGSRLPLQQALQGLALAALGLVLMSLDDGAIGPESLPFFLPLTAAVWGLGRVVHGRNVLVAELHARTGELRRRRDERARLEVATDRARLSSELDALLQRRLEELAALAATGRREEEPDAAVAAFEAIERQSRRTLDDMRSMVGVLRHDELPSPAGPQPTLRNLEALLLRGKGSGARLEVDGNPRALPAGVELSAYRVVEQLLDALEDVGDVRVRVRFGDDALELGVTGPARRAGAESALQRARERVELHHGTLVTSTRAGRAEAVAQLPVALVGI